MTRLFVGNLHYDATEQELKQFFESLSLDVVSVKILMDKETQRSRGFGFVEVKESLETALEVLQGVIFCNRPLRVEVGNRK